jgi:hypothetical protein
VVPPQAVASQTGRPKYTAAAAGSPPRWAHHLRVHPAELQQALGSACHCPQGAAMELHQASPYIRPRESRKLAKTAPEKYPVADAPLGSWTVTGLVPGCGCGCGGPPKPVAQQHAAEQPPKIQHKLPDVHRRGRTSCVGTPKRLTRHAEACQGRLHTHWQNGCGARGVDECRASSGQRQRSSP